MFLNPFLPYKKPDIVIVDGRISEDIIKKLEYMKIKVIKTRKHNKLYDAISYHPDIIIHPIDSKTIIVEPSEYTYYKDILKNHNVKVLKGEVYLDRNYPNNIAYNVARLRNFAIHKIKHMDPKLKYYLKKNNYEFINVKQGYSKCSIAIVAENSIITSDKGIEKELKKYGINVLLINEGYINLKGLNYGFVGGSVGVLNKNKVFFSGEYSHHPDYRKINNFIIKNGKKPKKLSNKKLIDIGSIIPLICN